MKALAGRIITWIKLHKRISIIAGGLIFALAVAAGGLYLLKNPPWLVRTVTNAVTKEAEPAKPVTKASPLTGVQVKPELADKPIFAVVIENHSNARPQSGLSEAGVVYEALAEGGITRYLAFYLENRPKELGPIRSLRTYFVDWALEFDAPVAHVGGNADALDLVSPLRMKDLDQFAFGSYYYRTRDRYAPHNMYSTGEKMDALLKALNYDKPAAFTSSPRKADQPATAEVPAAHPVIRINYSYNGFQVEYRYDPATNDYARFLAGRADIDRNTGQQIRVKNVVMQVMPTSFGTTRIGEQTVIMGTPGSGKTIVFRDGSAVTGTWKKATHRDRTKLLDAAGAEIPLNAGNTWYAVVPPDRAVSY